MNIPFNKPYMTGKELFYIAEAHFNGKLAGDGPFTRRCHEWLEQRTGTRKALLTHSCTAALEMAALLLDLAPGDEVVMPSYTFVSTANAFVLRGATPVFVDIRPDTLNIDERLIEAAITPRTRAIVVVHYAGVGCEMDTIMAIAQRHGLFVVEDAAQGLMASYRGRALGSIGHLGCLSFHETKNIISGEGGALLVNDPRWLERAEILREKGTNRSQFFRGEVDKYTWCDVGSSYLPGEITAAFLYAQFEEAEEITSRRLKVWSKYNEFFIQNNKNSVFSLPMSPNECVHNAHMYAVRLPSLSKRSDFIAHLKSREVNAVFHYVPLHSSQFGRGVGRCYGSIENTNKLSDQITRLPLWVGIEKNLDNIFDAIISWLNK